MKRKYILLSLLVLLSGCNKTPVNPTPSSSGTTPSVAPTHSVTPSVTVTPSESPTPSVDPSIDPVTPTPSISPTPSETPYVTPTPSIEPTEPTVPVSPTPFIPVTPTPTVPITPTPSVSPTPTEETYPTIDKIIEMCNALPKASDNINIVTSEIEVTFIAQAIDGIDTKTAKKGYTPQMKVVVVDSTGYLLCASNSGSQSENTLYRSFVNNKTKRNSKYIITGNIGLYRGQPEVVVTSFKFQEDLVIEYDLSDYSKGHLSIVNDFYEKVIEEVDYNSKGAGIGAIYEFEDAKCLGKADNNSWIFTDGSYVFGVYDFISNTSFTKGEKYNLLGMLTTTQWKPSFRVYDYSINLDERYIGDPYDNYQEITIKDTFNIKRPKLDEDDFKRYPDYLRSFKHVYKSDVYFDYYNQKSSSQDYIVCGDNYYENYPTSNQIAASRYYVRFDTLDFSFALLNDYYGANEKLTIYYSLYQQDQVTYNKVTYMQWKIYLFSDMLDL